MGQETWLLLLPWSFCVSAVSAIAQCLLQFIAVSISIRYQYMCIHVFTSCVYCKVENITSVSFRFL